MLRRTGALCNTDDEQEEKEEGADTNAETVADSAPSDAFAARPPCIRISVAVVFLPDAAAAEDEDEVPCSSSSSSRMSSSQRKQ